MLQTKVLLGVYQDVYQVFESIDRAAAQSVANGRLDVRTGVVRALAEPILCNTLWGQFVVVRVISVRLIYEYLLKFPPV